MKNFLNKIRALSENKRKIILWTIVVILGITLFIFYVKGVDKKIKNLQGGLFSSQMKLPELKENLNQFPSQDVGSAIKSIQEILNQNKNQNEETIKEESKNQ
jgi:hypothetical protein